MDMIRCIKCGADKDASLFYRTGRHRAGSVCRPCKIEYSRQWRIKNPEKQAANLRDAQYRRLYGISTEQYEAMKAKQDGKCAMCFSEKKLVVDHNHDTGKIRGLICFSCNTGIGLLGDSIEGIERALRYLKLTNQEIA